MNKTVNLVVFIDGTGNNDFKMPHETQTNVARLKHACEKIDPIGQRVYYKPGVGTRTGEKVGGNAWGLDLDDRVSESLSWLKNEIDIAQEDGNIPRVYLYGFSRGAYAVRWLANELNYNVEVLGVWDTVKATFEGPNVDVLPQHVLHAFHAMAIDEHRSLFDVTHFKDSSQACEVWFPGCHSDVGGGYAEAELAYAPLNWMVRMSKMFGLLVDDEMIPGEPDLAEVNPVMHDESKDIFWEVVDGVKWDLNFKRVIAATDMVYPSVRRLREWGYAPDFLPNNCFVWNESSFMANLA